MYFDPDIHHRRSIRLKGYDYSASGAYFVTICAQHKDRLFGDVIGGAMRLNDAGQMVERWWIKLTAKFPTAEPDEYIVMPNHFHGIVLVGAAPSGRPNTPPPGDRPRDVEMECTDPNARAAAGRGHPHGGAPTLGDIIDWFKTMTTNEYIRGVRQTGWPPFRGRLWQRNYYEHIIRSEEELFSIRSYIQANPLKWDLDRENPAAQGMGPVERWEA